MQARREARAALSEALDLCRPHVHNNPVQIIFSTVHQKSAFKEMPFKLGKSRAARPQHIFGRNISCNLPSLTCNLASRWDILRF